MPGLSGNVEPWTPRRKLIHLDSSWRLCEGEFSKVAQETEVEIERVKGKVKPKKVWVV